MTMKTVVLFLLTAVSLSAADGTMLKYSLTKNTVVPYQLVTTTIQRAQVGERASSTTVSMVMPFTVKVQDAMLGTSTVTGTYDTAYVISRSGADSTLMPDNTKQSTYDALAGLSDEVTITAAGGIVSARSDLDTLSSGARVGAWSQGLRGLLMPFPAEPVTPGVTWTQERRDTVTPRVTPGSVVSTSTYTYTFLGTVDTLGMKCARISSTSNDIKLEGTFVHMGTTMPITGSGVSDGIIIVDLATGLPVLSDVRMDMLASMDMSAVKQGTMPLQTKTRATLQRRTDK
jgi:hypothetical protein